MSDKCSLRKEIRKKRKEVSDEWVEKNSDIIAEKLFQLHEYSDSELILCYSDYRHEVMTEKIISYALKHNKKVALPRVENDIMNFYYIESINQLVPGYNGILEPKPIKLVTVEDAKTAFMVMPGTSFDRNGNRNGYGGGYYDRYLLEHPCRYCAGIAFSFQVFDEIPYESHDKKVDFLITENELLCFNNR